MPDPSASQPAADDPGRNAPLSPVEAQFASVLGHPIAPELLTGAETIDLADFDAAEVTYDGLPLTAEDTRDFGDLWYQALAAVAALPLDRRLAEARFGTWTGILLQHLGATVHDPEGRPLPPPNRTPGQIGTELSYTQRMTPDVLEACLLVLGDLSARYTPQCPQSVRYRVIGDFAHGFCGGAQNRTREDRAVLTEAIARARAAAPDSRDRFVPEGPEVAATLTLDADGEITEATTAAQELLGRPLPELWRRAVADLTADEEDRAAVREAVRTVLGPGGTVRTDFRVRTAHRGRWVTATFGRIAGPGQPEGVIALLEDSTLRHAVEHGQSVDEATGALTEEAFLRCARPILRAGHSAAMITVRAVDRSSAFGPAILHRIVRRLGRADDAGTAELLVGRSGDDIVLLAHHPSGPPPLHRLTAWLRRRIGEPMHLGAHRISLRPRIGVVPAGVGDRAEDLLRRSRIGLSVPIPRAESEPEPAGGEHRFALLGQLAQAVDRARLDVRYRPIRRRADSVLLGVQLVPGWTGPDGVRHELADVLDVALDTGLVAGVLPAALTAACADLADWPASATFLVLDLPGSTAEDPAVLAALAETAGAVGLSDGRLHLSVPGAAFAAGFPRSLAELAATGVALDVDGTAGPLPLPTRAWSTAVLDARAGEPGPEPLAGLLELTRGLGLASRVVGLAPADPRAAAFTECRAPDEHTAAEIAALLSGPAEPGGAS